MILHVDMDAFYASVEEGESPELRGQPVVVGGTPQGRGVVAAANYEARKFGIHSAMPTGRALTLCPHAVVLRHDWIFMRRSQNRFGEIFQRFTPEIEPLSLDEAFLDTTGCERLFGSAETIGRAIKSAIREELHLIASVGVRPINFLQSWQAILISRMGLQSFHQTECKRLSTRCLSSEFGVWAK